jgi:hypothetical protein
MRRENLIFERVLPLREIEKFSDLFFPQRMGASWPLPFPFGSKADIAA